MTTIKAIQRAYLKTLCTPCAFQILEVALELQSKGYNCRLFRHQYRSSIECQMHSILQLIDPKEIGFPFMLNRVLLLSLCRRIVAHFTDLQKLVYIRGTQRLQFKMESYLRRWLCDTRYALRTRNTYQLAGYVQCFSIGMVFTD